jgi:hypothetical protein
LLDVWDLGKRWKRGLHFHIDHQVDTAFELEKLVTRDEPTA